jgi:hypothetical protein
MPCRPRRRSAPSARDVRRLVASLLGPSAASPRDVAASSPPLDQTSIASRGAFAWCPRVESANVRTGRSIASRDGRMPNVEFEGSRSRVTVKVGGRNWSESFRCLAASSRRKMQPYQLAGRQECGVFLSVYLLTVPINDLSRASELTVNRATTPASSISFSNQFARMACNPHKENGATNSARLGSRSFVSYIRSLASFAATDEECR